MAKPEKVAPGSFNLHDQAPEHSTKTPLTCNTADIHIRHHCHCQMPQPCSSHVCPPADARPDMEALLASAGGGPGGGRGGGGRTPGGSIMAGMPGMPSIGGAPMGARGCAGGVMRMATPFSICSAEQVGMVGTL